MLPAWATIVLSLVTAAAALAGVLLSARHEQKLQLRERQISTAADFSLSALDAIAAVKDVVRSASTFEADAKDKARALLHEAEARQGLLGLLFERTRGTAPGHEIICLLQKAVREIDLQDGAPDCDFLKRIRGYARDAEEKLDPFYQDMKEILRRRRRWSGFTSRLAIPRHRPHGEDLEPPSTPGTGAA
jgi:hypothetical protein